jgi:bidirectional [NiFe] hydrogenase diaphorase subunit
MARRRSDGWALEGSTSNGAVVGSAPLQLYSLFHYDVRMPETRQEDARMMDAAVPIAAVGHRSGDERFSMLDAAMKRYWCAPDALIEVLHVAQELFGCLDPGLLHYVAHGLKLPPSRVYGVATFYHLFSFVPRGEHSCVVCTGTACYVQGAGRLLTAVQESLAIAPGETTADGRVSLLSARCVGTCGLAVVVVYDGEVAGDQDPTTACQRVKGWLGDGAR